MNPFPTVEMPQPLTVRFAPPHVQWLHEMAEQEGIDVDTVLFWVIHTASRSPESPWPPGFQEWSPFRQEQ